MIGSNLKLALATTTVWATVAAAATQQLNVTYVCDGGQQAVAVYEVRSSQGGAVVTFGGNTFSFKSAKSGSGVRYTTAGGIHDIAPLEWWTKGQGSTLSELTPTGDRKRLIATCLATR
jgi:membrane-bound inhibitor of C-type lysozyme